MKLVVSILIGVVLFEFIEHVMFPLIWCIKDRKRKSVCGATGMVGKVGEITQWKEASGKVSVNGELWQAVSAAPLKPGDRVVVRNVKGLTLEVTRWRG